jgi:hypothetical protein
MAKVIFEIFTATSLFYMLRYDFSDALVRFAASQQFLIRKTSSLQLSRYDARDVPQVKGRVSGKLLAIAEILGINHCHALADFVPSKVVKVSLGRGIYRGSPWLTAEKGSR